jgi:release factor glutamine methyltransferase
LAVRIADAATRLRDVTETPRLDAEILLAHAMGISRAQLLARLRDRLEIPQYEPLLERRLACEPIAYIFGEWEFFSLPFRVVPPLLVPRPETEHLVEAVLERVGNQPARLLEIGTGTGCVAISIACNAPNARVVATDINPRAVQVAAQNAVRHHVAGRVEFRQGDLFEPVAGADSTFDVICSNPPYVETSAWDELPPVIRLYEDPRALLAGPDGLDVVRRLVSEGRRFLKPDGMLAFEIGMGQRAAVEQLLAENGYRDIMFRRDLAGIDRIASGVFTPTRGRLRAAP